MLIEVDFGESPVYSIWNGLKDQQKLVDENGKDLLYTPKILEVH